MSEQVQAVLDSFVEPLHELQKRGIFTENEIQTTVARRRDSEFLLRRRNNPRKSDYLEYLQKEIQLEELRKLRTERKRAEKKEEQQRRRQQQRRSKEQEEEDDDNANGGGNKPPSAVSDNNKHSKHKHASDKHIISHIHLLWVRTLRKFKSDVNLFHEYAEFCKSNQSYNQLSKCYQQALQFHPHHVEFWCDAASHEYFDRQNISAARILFQRAIRTMNCTSGTVSNSTSGSTASAASSGTTTASQELWIQYFALELHVVQKLVGRKKILTSANTSDASVADDGVGEGNEKQDRNDFDYSIAQIVLDHALKSCANNNVDDSVQLRLRLLEQCEMFPHTEALQQRILDSLEKDYGQSTTAWMARIQYVFNKKNLKNRKKKDDGGAVAHHHQEENNETTEHSDDNEEEESDAEQNKDDEQLERLTKRPRLMEPQDDDDDDDDGDDQQKESLDAVIRQAIMMCPTEEMMVQIVHFVQTHYKKKDNGDQLIIELLEKQAPTSSAKLASIHAEHYSETQHDVRSAIQCIENFINYQKQRQQNQRGRDDDEERKEDGNATSVSATAAVVPAYLWVQWARMLWETDKDDPNKAAIKVLERGLKDTSLHTSSVSKSKSGSSNDYLILLLQLSGLYLLVDTNNKTSTNKYQLGQLFSKLLLLAPGWSSDDEWPHLQHPMYQAVWHIPSLCRQYLHYLLDVAPVDFRMSYESLLYKSTLIPQLIETDAYEMKLLMDCILEKECLSSSSGGGNKITTSRQKRLYDTAIQMFRGTSLSSHYKQRKDEELVYRTHIGNPTTPKDQPFQVPVFDLSTSDDLADRVAELEQAYKDYQVVYVKHARNWIHDDDSSRSAKKDQQITWKDIGSIFSRLDEKDKKSWCIETKGGISSSLPSPSEFLAPSVSSCRAYCSFLTQHDTDNYESMLKRLPVAEIPTLEWHYEPALWLFFGRNPLGNSNLDGRPDHTDSVSHDGTWHYQLAGTKQWFLRPTREMASKLVRQQPSFSEDWHVRIDCREGDMLVVNTRLWFHRTVIPPQGIPSVSYARDFRFNAGSSGPDGMTNVDGLYATQNIDSGTIIFKEKDMPDCALHRSATNPNCEVVELDDGTHAVVSCRDISAGEFFCIAESSDDESSGESVDEND